MVSARTAVLLVLRDGPGYGRDLVRRIQYGVILRRIEVGAELSEAVAELFVGTPRSSSRGRCRSC